MRRYANILLLLLLLLTTTTISAIAEIALQGGSVLAKSGRRYSVAMDRHVIFLLP